MTGKRNLCRHPDGSRLRSVCRPVTRTLYGVRPPDPLAAARRELNLAMRLHRKWIKEMPEVFDPQIIAQRRREEGEKLWRERVIRPMLDRIYGPDEVDRSPKIPTGLQSV